ncbi:hypothetical protein AO943_37300 [Pseudomonas aeruginosa]|nr:hypothetical protein AO943_37300 [Pseudomonas aeruginosa]
MNTWVSFQSAEQPLLGQFSVSGNRLSVSDAIRMLLTRIAADKALPFDVNRVLPHSDRKTP